MVIHEKETDKRKKEYESPKLSKLHGDNIHGGATQKISENTSGWVASGS